MSRNVLLNSVEKIKAFETVVRDFPYDINLIAGNRKYLDAKSILGILSCDVSQPMKMVPIAPEEDVEELFDAVGQFVVSE